MDYVFRGGVQFNLDNFRKYYGAGNYLLLSAVLQCWQQPPHDECGADGSTLIFVASGDWAHGVLDDYLVPTTGGDEDYVDAIPPFTTPPAGGLTGLQRINVSPQVLDWISGARSNFGFCFVGTDDSMPDDVTKVCVNQFGLFQLEINYLPFDGWEPEDIFPPDHPQISPRWPRRPAAFAVAGGRVPAILERRLKDRRQKASRD